MHVRREAIERVPGFLLVGRLGVGLAGEERWSMASSQKKREREQNAAARRERAEKRRSEKSLVCNGTSSTVGAGMPVQTSEAALPVDPAAET
jgi:hypothetical protein